MAGPEIVRPEPGPEDPKSYRGMTDPGTTRHRRLLTNVGSVTSTPLHVRRLTGSQLQVLDAGYAVLVAVLCLYAAAEPGSGWHEPAWVTALAGVALGAPVAIRRNRPMTASALVLAAAALSLAVGVIPDFAAAAPIVAVGLVLYTVGTSLTRRKSAITAVLAVVVIVEGLYLAADSPFDPGIGQASAFAALILGLCWALGWTVRERRAYAAQLNRQATVRAVDDERLRIAREMHDIVAHSMSLIAVKATIANHVADERPQEVRDALRVIEATSRTALAELRRTLGALRTEVELAPAPGIADLPRLVEATTAAGIEVQLHVEGIANLPEGVGLAVFRIVQEGLTNVVRHAAASHCRVTVADRSGVVVIEIVDDGRGGPAGTKGEPDHRRGETENGQTVVNDEEGWGGLDGSLEADVAGGRGQGLIGMRERVALYRGELRAAPGPEGGWVLRATLDTAA